MSQTPATPNAAARTFTYEQIVAAATPDEQPAPRTVTVGRFSMDSAGVVEGPAAYMRERGNARLRRIEAGLDYLVNYGLSSGLAPNAETAVLVSLQTDFAAWLGEQEMVARQEAARASQQEFLARMATQRPARRRR